MSHIEKSGRPKVSPKASTKRVTSEELGVPLLGAIPPATNAAVSRSMKANRAKDTKPEIALRHALWSAGLRGYRINWTQAPGRPDIAYPGRRLAIFVHGCYWHRCPICDRPLPKNNTEFWQRKFVRNQERDLRKRRELEEAGWRVIEVWECQVLRASEEVVATIREAMNDIASAKKQIPGNGDTEKDLQGQD